MPFTFTKILLLCKTYRYKIEDKGQVPSLFFSNPEEEFLVEVSIVHIYQVKWLEVCWFAFRDMVFTPKHNHNFIFEVGEFLKINLTHFTVHKKKILASSVSQIYEYGHIFVFSFVFNLFINLSSFAHYYS